MEHDESNSNGNTPECDYVHRRLNAETRRQWAMRYLDNLEDLYIFSKNKPNIDGTPGKDFAARDALLNIRLFTKLMAGWAVDHAVGKAVGLQELLPPYDPMTRASPHYRAWKEKADLHEHERRGGSISDESNYVSQLDPRVTRQALLNLVEANSIGLPRDMACQVVEALRALSWGEVLPIFAPDPGLSKKKRFRQLNAQLRALEHVEFRVALRKTRVSALKTVSSAYGVPVETLKTWNRRAKQGLGEIHVDARLQMARNMAGTYNGKPIKYGIENKYLVRINYSHNAMLMDAASLRFIEEELKAKRIKIHGQNRRD